MPLTKHTVHFNFKAVPPSNIHAMDDVIGKLQQSAVFGILSYSGLKPVHPTIESEMGLHLNFTHSFEMIFCTAASRDNYLPHPIHMTAVENLVALGLQPDAGKVCTVDCDAVLPGIVVQHYISQFEKRHHASIIDTLLLIEDSKKIMAAMQDFTKTINYYAQLEENSEQKDFWNSLNLSPYAIESKVQH